MSLVAVISPAELPGGLQGDTFPRNLLCYLLWPFKEGLGALCKTLLPERRHGEVAAVVVATLVGLTEAGSTVPVGRHVSTSDDDTASTL